MHAGRWNIQMMGFFFMTLFMGILAGAYTYFLKHVRIIVMRDESETRFWFLQESFPTSQTCKSERFLIHRKCVCDECKRWSERWFAYRHKHTHARIIIHGGTDTCKSDSDTCVNRLVDFLPSTRSHFSLQTGVNTHTLTRTHSLSRPLRVHIFLCKLGSTRTHTHAYTHTYIFSLVLSFSCVLWIPLLFTQTSGSILGLSLCFYLELSLGTLLLHIYMGCRMDCVWGFWTRTRVHVVCVYTGPNATTFVVPAELFPSRFRATGRERERGWER